MKSLLREYLKEFLYFRNPEKSSGFKGVLQKFFNDSDDDVDALVDAWISYVEDLNDWEIDDTTREKVSEDSKEIYPSVLRRVSYDKKLARKGLSKLLKKKFYKSIKISQNLDEVAGDYKMSGLRRFDAPGNIRSGFLVKRSGGSLQKDVEEETAHATPAAAIVLITRGDKVLAVSRGTDYQNMNMPGGGVEAGEKPEEAAVRELREETGLSAHNLIPVCSELAGDKIIYFYRVTKFSGNIRSSNEGIAKWEDPDVVLNSQYGASFRKVLSCLPGDVLTL